MRRGEKGEYGGGEGGGVRGMDRVKGRRRRGGREEGEMGMW